MIQPLNSFVAIEIPPKEEISSGGIFIPGGADADTDAGKVVAVAKDVSSVSVGHIVVWKKYAADSIKIDGKDYLLVSVKDLLAIIK